MGMGRMGRRTLSGLWTSVTSVRNRLSASKGLLPMENTSADTSIVFGPFETRPLSTEDSFSKTGRGLTRPAGWRTSSVARWYREERSYGITGAGLLFSAAYLFFILGVWLGVKYAKTKNGSFIVGAKTYVVAGLGEIRDASFGEEKVFTPVYREVK